MHTATVDTEGLRGALKGSGGLADDYSGVSNDFFRNDEHMPWIHA
jgi:hypothetical protein